MADLVFQMPSLGADMEAGTLVTWRVGLGDRVQRGDVIAEVETEKGLIEVEVFVDGVVVALLVEPGTKVPVGTPMARLQGGASAPVIASGPRPEAAPGRVTPAARKAAARRGIDPATIPGSGRDGIVLLADIEGASVSAAPASVSATPSARRRAREEGVDLTQIEGTRPHGVIGLEDVTRALTATGAASQGGSGRPETSMRAAIAAAMARSKREIPHYYLSHTIDLTGALGFLERHNVGRPPAERVLLAALLLRATARALRKHPELNAHWRDGRPVACDTLDVGIAISLRGGGLVAPRIRDTDTLDLAALMVAMTDLVERARGGTLRASEMAPGSLTVTSLGERGVDLVVPVILPPQVAMVGFGTPTRRPWVVGDACVPRPVLTMTLAADHRVTDGHLGARFLARIASHLESPETP